MKLKKTILLFLLKLPEQFSEPGTLLFLLFFFMFPVTTSLNAQQVIRKSEISFLSTDSLRISANHYYSNKDNPYILLFHTESSSRGEYDSIASRFVKMNYNCLAVDLRSGDEFRYIENITANRARDKGLSNDYAEAEKDVEAAIHYVNHINDKKMVLLGSSYSATLCLKVAKNNPLIKSVMAFSPGEFFQPEFQLDEHLKDYDKPVFIAYSKSEAEYIEKLTVHLSDSLSTFFNSNTESPYRGVRLLFPDNPANDEYWFSVLIFIKSLTP